MMMQGLPNWIRRIVSQQGKDERRPEAAAERGGGPAGRVVLLVACAELGPRTERELQRSGATVVRAETYGLGVVPYHVDSATAAYLNRRLAAVAPTDVVVCGHVECHAVRAIVEQTRHPDGGPAAGSATVTVLRRHYAALGVEALREVASQEHVLTQLEALNEYPAMGALQARPRLSALLHDERTDAFLLYDPDSGQFEAIRPYPELAPGMSPWSRGCP